MWTVFNEYGEIYTTEYTRKEAERTAEEINGYCRYIDNTPCNYYCEY